MQSKTAENYMPTKSNFLRTVGLAISTMIERRRTRAALGKLDDFMLKDMGIARSDIERIANRTYPPR